MQAENDEVAISLARAKLLELAERELAIEIKSFNVRGDVSGGFYWQRLQQYFIGAHANPRRLFEIAEQLIAIAEEAKERPAGERKRGVAKEKFENADCLMERAVIFLEMAANFKI